MDDGVRNRAHFFPTTRWSQLKLVDGQVNSVRREALDKILRTYIPALRSYLLLKKKIPAQYVDDLVQGFITQQIIEKDIIASASQDKGRFRNYIRTILNRYLISEYRRQTTAKRNQGAAIPLDNRVEPVDPSVDDAAHGFDLEWARTVLATALKQMRETCQYSNRNDVWTLFELRLVNPMLYGKREIPYTELIRRLGLRSPSQATSLLTTAKRMFIRTLRSVIGQYAESDPQIDEEIADLFKILPMSGACPPPSHDQAAMRTPATDDDRCS